MKYILNKKLKYYTKEILKYFNITIIAFGLIIAIVLIKYKPIYKVSISGEELGYVQTPEALNETILKNVEEESNASKENIDNINITKTPEYELKLVSRTLPTNEQEIASKIAENVEVTYKYYAVTLDEEQKSIVNSLEEAEKLVAEMEEEYEDSVDFTIGINELYTKDKDEYETVDIEVAEAKVSEQLQEIADASVNGVYLSQRPVSGVITSRFGNRESIRTYAHTGLDIAAPYGTPIKAAAGGTVSVAQYSGSYGNLIVVDCGNGVEIYYGHCSSLYVSAGDEVEAGDVIGAVGSTGNSTGNHLHFEIRVNGTRVNPQNYIYN